MRRSNHSRCLFASLLLLAYVEGFQGQNTVARQQAIVKLSTSTSQQNDKEEVESLSRRECLTRAASSSFWWLSFPMACVGADPVTEGEVNGVGAIIQRAVLRPNPPKVLRFKLDQDFAVLLMRSSYMALDRIDCVAMDQFQRDFFLIRSSEYEPYLKAVGVGVVQQGMLTDPYYFDFISFAQYATISREINNNPQSLFTEQQPSKQDQNNENDDDQKPQKFVPQIIKRDPLLSDSMLSERHSKLVGASIVDWLMERYGDQPAFDILRDSKRSSPAWPAAVLKSLNGLVKLFVVYGYGTDYSAAIVKQNDKGPVQFCLSISVPANIWSGKTLQLTRANPVNCFVLKAATELLDRAGYIVSKSSIKYEDLKEATYLTISNPNSG